MSDTGIGEGAEYGAFTGPKHELVDRPLVNLGAPDGGASGGESIGGMIHNSIMTRRQHMENAAHRAWLSEEGDKQHQRHLELMGVHHDQEMAKKQADAAHQHSIIDRAAPGTMVSVEGGGHRATFTTAKAPTTRASRSAAAKPAASTAKAAADKPAAAGKQPAKTGTGTTRNLAGKKVSDAGMSEDLKKAEKAGVLKRASGGTRAARGGAK